MVARLFFCTVVFHIVLRIQGSHAQDMCDPGNGENILITNVDDWEDVLNDERVQELIRKLEEDEQFNRIHFHINVDETKDVEKSDGTDIECEDGWRKASNDHCYKLFNDTKVNFTAANRSCGEKLNNNAILAIGVRNLTIKSEIIDAFGLNKNLSDRRVWIGLMQNSEKENWHWIDGKVMNKTVGKNGWKKGEPNNGNQGAVSNDNDEDCAALDRNHDFNFSDFGCSSIGYYICESMQGYNKSAFENWWEIAQTSP